MAAYTPLLGLCFQNKVRHTNRCFVFTQFKKSLKVPQGYSEAINRRFRQHNGQEKKAKQ